MVFILLTIMFLVFLGGLVAVTERLIYMPKLNSVNGWASAAFGVLCVVCMYVLLVGILEVVIYG